MAKPKKKNSLGVKVVKFLLVMVLGLLLLNFILPPLFTIIAPFIHALPFEVPTNFIVADYIGMFILGLSLLLVLFYSVKWGFR